MSVTLNGNTYTATGAATNYDLIGANGYGYRSVVGGSELFPSRIFNDMLAELASAATAQSGVTPGTSGNLLTSNGSAWVSSTPVAPLPLAGGTMTGDLKFTDATYDIGKSGATRPRDGFFSRNVTVGGTLTAGSGTPKLYVNASGVSVGARANDGLSNSVFQVWGATQGLTFEPGTTNGAASYLFTNYQTTDGSLVLGTFTTKTILTLATSGGATFSGGLTLSAFGSGGGAVSVGAADSGGTGYKVLRVPN